MKEKFNKQKIFINENLFALYQYEKDAKKYCLIDIFYREGFFEQFQSVAESGLKPTIDYFNNLEELVDFVKNPTWVIR